MGKYLAFMDDEKLISAISKLYSVYEKSYSTKTLKELNKNIIDPFKFQMDTVFLNGGDAKVTMANEILRQSDKSIANAVGVFHQQLMGAIDGFCETPQMPCDVKKLDNTVFVEVKNKHNTMNIRSAAGVYEELEGIAKTYQDAMCYIVEVIAKKSVDEVWRLTVNQKNMSHKRIHKISADKFYELATGDPGAFKKLCDILPVAIADYLQERKGSSPNIAETSTAYKALLGRATENQTRVEEEIFKIAFSTYNHFSADGK